MGTLGTSVRNVVDSIIINPAYRSTITITPITRSKGTSGGYGAVTETESDSETAYAIPYDSFPNRAELLKVGDLVTGDLSLIMRYNQTIDEDDQITWQEVNYHIREIEEIPFNDVIVAKAVTLSRVLSSS